MPLSLLLPLWTASYVLPSAPHLSAHSRCADVSMGFFDGLAAAFENDDSLGERGDAGLKKRVQLQTVTWKGPPPEGMAAMFEKQKVTEVKAIPGQSLKDLADDAGVDIRYSCMKGTCHICDVNVDGSPTPACIAKMPKKDITIEYRDVSAAGAYAKAALKADREARMAAKAGGASPAATQGKVTPTAPFGNPFQMPNPFEQQKAEAAAQKLSSLEQRLKDENAAKKSAASSKGGWPFG